MEINVSPKQQFMAMDQMASEFRVIVLKNSLQTAITYATAEMNASSKFTSDQMQAVQTFIKTFLNLAERIEPTKKYPSKSLTSPEPRRANKPQTETIR